jgi:hypothetical protein
VPDLIGLKAVRARAVPDTKADPSGVALALALIGSSILVGCAVGVPLGWLLGWWMT